MDKISLNNLLLISAEGRNFGKTSLGCKIVSELSQRGKVTAVKISPHFHKLTDSLDVILESSSLIISKEKSSVSSKDSSRYLRAGASEVYYIQCKEDAFETLAKWMQKNLTGDIPVICEAGGLGSYINPGYSIHIRMGVDAHQLNSPINWIHKKWQA